LSSDELRQLQEGHTPALALEPAAEFASAAAGASTPRRRALSVIPRVSGTVVLIVVLAALIAPFFAPHGVGDIVGQPYAKPGTDGVLGTDYLGRDLLSRLLAGGRSLVLLSFLCTFAAGCLGTAIGLITGYSRGLLDSIVMRFADLLLILPPLVVLLVLTSGWGGGTLILVPVIMISASPYIARIVRAATLGVSSSQYVEASVLRGESRRAILVREILPNVAGPVLAITGLLLVYSIYVIASASFLGVGAQPPTADWALMIREGMTGVMLNAWPVVLPAIFIIVLAVSVNVFADGLHGRIAGGRAGRQRG
jgi:peptide/nickel transport system permease protein